MSRVKDYALSIADAGDGVADMTAIEELEFEKAYKEYEYNKLKKELAK